jgi:hypothetical protein
MLVTVRQFLTKSPNKPVPLRTMRLVETKRETEKAILVKLEGTPNPSSNCVHCGREITHPQSLHFGIGSTCIEKYPHLLAMIDYNEIEKSYEMLKAEMSKITWEGWLPKGHIEMIPEEVTNEIKFIYDHQVHCVHTKDSAKIEQIYANADEIISNKAVEV